MKILEMQHITYAYNRQDPVLADVSLAMETGKMYAILGPSGSGKTTLLSLAGGLDSPTEGRILFNGKPVEKFGLEKHRKRNISLIFQNYNLIDYMNAAENVRLSAKGSPAGLLTSLGLTDEEVKRNVLKLSGGQQQRVAIARALASPAPIILADEPTGNLDRETARDITAILKRSAHESGKCVIIVTHSNAVAKEADIVFKIKNKTAVTLKRRPNIPKEVQHAL
ncbi:ABC transporter ATP-binding protein [Eubacterium sp. 1001713B170207_170306_E7]|uniref:ABC transporter ATP-binding protein n=1 Tax=Eubacterium sp. 1001713B170207_170306_E7 TaxID=2787097 RepID=UPI0018978FF2|nr:ABC transporter ATP-binding protein [Eubacterium sp. 1001713B170207_170306_E7]